MDASNWLHLIIQQFQMPFLMLISGFAFAIGQKKKLMESILKKSERLLIPYLCWAIITWVIYCIQGRSVNLLHELVHSPFWFLRVLWGIAMVLIFAQALVESLRLKVLCHENLQLALKVFVAFVGIYGLKFIPGFKVGFALGCFVLIGYLLGYYRNKLERHKVSTMYCLAIVTIAWIVGNIFNVAINTHLTIKGLKAIGGCCFAGFGSLVAYVILSRIGVGYDFLERIGRNTLPIYAIHWCLFFQPNFIHFDKILPYPGLFWIKVVMVFIAWVVASCLLIKFIEMTPLAMPLLGAKRIRI